MQKRLCTQKIPNHKKLDSWTVLETPHHLQDSQPFISCWVWIEGEGRHLLRTMRNVATTLRATSSLNLTAHPSISARGGEHGNG